ncbi:MAG: leucine-rich repeat domain-containing protein [Bacteroidales bacterium]|nr:leucine-rich repeat domain-containing protein [Bacteroidales bacterium]
MNTFYKVLFVLAILIANSISASAIEFTVDGVLYSVNNDNTTVMVAGYPSGSKPTGDLTIPESVTYGDISYSVTSIGSDAFYDCSGLTSVTIPNSVTEIGSGAFDGTAWYNNQPDGLVYAGLVAYQYKGTMPSGTSIVLKEGTKGIAGFAFFYCTGLTSVTIPNSVTSIGDWAFYGCSGLTSVTIPNSVTSIGDYAFSSCSGLTSVTIGNSVTSIGNKAFSDCSGLTSVTIPNSVTSIGESAFYYCLGLTRIDAYPDPEKVSTGTDAFYAVPKDGTLHVLPKYLSAYQTASQWEDFTNIKGDLTEIGGIEVVRVDELDHTLPMNVYNMNGVKMGDRLEDLPAGIYIVRQGSKSAKVVK